MTTYKCTFCGDDLRADELDDPDHMLCEITIYGEYATSCLTCLSLEHEGMELA